MIQVRTTYQVKFGKIDQAIDLFGRLPQLVSPPQGFDMHYHLLSDVSGPMYTLVEELMLPSLAEWQPAREALFKHPEFPKWFKDYQQFIDGGQTQFYTVEGAYEEWSLPGLVVVREEYHALKWQIRPAVDLLQRYGALLTHFEVGRKPRILTDLSGPMFRAVIEIETDGLSDWEQNRRRLFREAEFQVWFVQLCSHVEAGAHTFLRVEL